MIVLRAAQVEREIGSLKFKKIRPCCLCTLDCLAGRSFHQNHCRHQNYSESGKIDPGINQWIFLSSLQDKPCLEFIVVSNQFLGLRVFQGKSLAGQSTGICLKAISSNKIVFEITGPAFSRIYLVIVSAWTVVSEQSSSPHLCSCDGDFSATPAKSCDFQGPKTRA